jgi:hypothetical protein
MEIKIYTALNPRNMSSKAKQRVFEVLRALKLDVSPQKTKMGKLSGFNFLGVDYGVSQNPQDEIQVTAEMHPRSCSRALGKVKAMRQSAVHTADIQRYLVRWGATRCCRRRLFPSLVWSGNHLCC